MNILKPTKKKVLVSGILFLCAFLSATFKGNPDFMLNSLFHQKVVNVLVVLLNYLPIKVAETLIKNVELSDSVFLIFEAVYVYILSCLFSKIFDRSKSKM